MAGDWIKMTHALPEKPEVLAIAGKTGINRHEVVGRLFTLWRWFDNHTTDGNALGVTSVTLEACLFGDGGNGCFVAAVVSVNWLKETDAGISVVKFDSHISESAKERAQTAKRVARSKSKDKGNAEGNGESVTSTVTKTVPREEKSREEKKDKEEKPAALTLDDLEAEGVSREAAAEWIAVRKRKKGGPVTPLAWSGFKAEAAKAGWPLEAAVRKCVQRVWVSFEAAWVANEKSGETPYQRSQREKYQQVTPAIAAKSPGVVGPTNVMEILDARVVAQIGR
jgi:chorismate mutase